jgi:hypothetical protein
MGHHRVSEKKLAEHGKHKVGRQHISPDRFRVMEKASMFLASTQTVFGVFTNVDSLLIGRNDHTTVTAPLPVCSAKLSTVVLG